MRRQPPDRSHRFRRLPPECSFGDERFLRDGRLTLRDGRTLAWQEYGPPEGRPLLRFQGMPGSRRSRHPHEDSYERFDVRMIVADRPGYGASTRLKGRGIREVASDAVELLDHLGLDSVWTTGTSGGSPHVLAFAALYPERVRAASVVVGAAPLLDEDTGGLIGLNREGWVASPSPAFWAATGSASATGSSAATGAGSWP